MERADTEGRVKGVVVYGQNGSVAEEWALPIAVTQAIQLSGLPVTPNMLSRHSCLGKMPVLKDMQKVPEMADSGTAWAWAFEHLLPKSSTTVAYHLYHYSPWIHTDPQSNATLANIDYAVQQNAFISNFKTGQATATKVNPLLARAMSRMQPMYSAFGWTDNEFSYVWMTTQTGASSSGEPNTPRDGGGGAVYCSFATPNLSFWRLLPIPGRTKARRLPVFDRGMK